MLSQLVERVEQGISTANDAAADAPISDGESIAVTFYTQADASSLADFLSANGGDPRNVGEGYVEAYVPVSLLVSASEQPGVTRVDAIVPPQPADATSLSHDSLDTQNAPASRGSIVSQGVALHGADAWHTAGFTGGGVKVGVISSGFNGLSSLMGSELPANVTARCYTGVGTFSSNLANCETGSSSGAAVSETLLDIAPDATLYISNPRSRGDLKTAVDWMVSQGVDVIDQSMVWFWDGPGDGTSLDSNSPLKSVDAAVSGGAVWANSAGNYARRTWHGQFTDANENNYLDFIEGVSDLNGVVIAAGERVTIQLRWDDSWTAADTDLDLYLFHASDLTTPVAFSETFQMGEADDKPFERLSYTSTAGGSYRIAARLWSDAAPGWVQLQSWSRNYIQRYSESGSIVNPAESANPGMLAAGAAHYWDTNTLAEYSSRGPAPDGRTKPDITGANCAQIATNNNPFLISGQQCWYDNTAQASAHAAGLAALVKGAFPTYTPQQIADYLKTNAQARGAKPNSDWGHGFARLPAPPQTAVTPVPTPVMPVPTPITPSPTPVTGGGDLADVARELQRQTNLLQQVIQSLQSLIQTIANR